MSTVQDRESIALANRLLSVKVRKYIQVQARMAGASRLGWAEAKLSTVGTSQLLIRIAKQAAMARTGKSTGFRIEESDMKFACDELGLAIRPSLRGGMSTKRHQLEEGDEQPAKKQKKQKQKKSAD